MKRTRNFVTTAFVALFAAGAYAACSVSPNLAGEAAVTAVESDKEVPRNLIARPKSDEGVPDRVSLPRADGEVPNNRVAAARSAERSYEHREPPPKHLVAVGSCRDLDLELPVAG